VRSRRTSWKVEVSLKSVGTQHQFISCIGPVGEFVVEADPIVVQSGACEHVQAVFEASLVFEGLTDLTPSKRNAESTGAK
jgi:hypothetical protein